MPEPTYSKIVTHRDFFSLLCNQHNLNNAVEIGVDRADYTCRFLERWKGCNLYCIDPYLPYPNMPFDRTGDFNLACVRLARFMDKVRIIKTTSREFCESLDIVDPATSLPNFKPDFVYIDAEHSYESVKKDIDLWWSKLTPFGVLSGHDYSKEFPGVRQAVNEFVESIPGAILFLTKDFPNSWFVFKDSHKAKLHSEARNFLS